MTYDYNFQDKNEDHNKPSAACYFLSLSYVATLIEVWKRRKNERGRCGGWSWEFWVVLALCLSSARAVTQPVKCLRPRALSTWWGVLGSDSSYFFWSRGPHPNLRRFSCTNSGTPTAAFSFFLLFICVYFYSLSIHSQWPAMWSLLVPSISVFLTLGREKIT